MSRRFALLLPVLLCPALAWALPPLPVSAAPAGTSASGHRLAVLLVAPGVTFERLMAVPEFRQMARAGGAGLMTSKVGSGDRTRAAYLTLASGSIATADAPTGGLADALEEGGVTVCVELADQGTGNPLALLAADRSGSPQCDLQAQTDLPAVALSRDTLLVIQANAFVPYPTPPLEGPIPRLGGIQRRLPTGPSMPEDWGQLAAILISGSSASSVLGMVVSPVPSSSMDAVGDEVTPVVLAQGPGRSLFPSNGPMHALTSDTTRQTGLVANVDVAPTILSFFGLPVPSGMDGSPIRPTGGAAPFGLHRLELQQRHIRLPLQLGQAAFVVVAGLMAIAALATLARGRSLPGGLLVSLRFIALCGAAMSIPVLAGGLLPRLTYPVVVPFVVLGVIGLAVLSIPGGRAWGPLGPFVFLGLAGLALLVIEAVLGGRAFRVPLVGGTMFDGIRFYGLPNSFIALLLASALFVAAMLPDLQGTALLFGAGLLAGMPSLGANLGASVMLFGAAALWSLLRLRRERLVGLRPLVTAAAIGLAGLALVLLANRYLPGAPTHVSHMLESTGSHGGGPLATIGRRLASSVRQLNGNVAGYMPMVGLVGVLLLALLQPPLIRAGLVLQDGWREVVIVMSAASLLGFFVNDTGVAAAAPGFLYAMAALAYPVFLAAQPRPTAPVVAPARPAPQPALGGRGS